MQSKFDLVAKTLSRRRGRAYAQDLQDRVLTETGLLQKVAARFGVSAFYISRARWRRCRLGSVSPGAECNYVPLCLAALHNELLAQVTLAPEQTLAQLSQWVKADHGLQAGRKTMGQAWTRLELTLKKKTLHTSEHERAVVARADWRAGHAAMVAVRRLICQATTNTVHTWSSYTKGERCVKYVPYGYWHTTTFDCALSAPGLLAPASAGRGLIDGHAFVAWVEQFLAPELRPNNIVVMDNLSLHKVSGVKGAIEGAGAVLQYLQPYSPDFYLMEKSFVKFKKACCEKLTSARTKQSGMPKFATGRVSFR